MQITMNPTCFNFFPPDSNEKSGQSSSHSPALIRPFKEMIHNKSQKVSIHKWSFCPISALCEKNNPLNIKHMPAVIFFACLDLEQKSSFMDGHQKSRRIEDIAKKDNLSSEIHFRFHKGKKNPRTEINQSGDVPFSSSKIYSYIVNLLSTKVQLNYSSRSSDLRIILPATPSHLPSGKQ